MKYPIGAHSFEAESPALTLELSASDPFNDAPEQLRERLEQDGYLLLRGLHDADQVLQVRRGILERLNERGLLDASAPLMDGIALPGLKTTASVRANADLKSPALCDLLYSDRAHRFFERLFGEIAQPYQYQWLRAAGPGAGSPIHADLPYMGRGSPRVRTLWTPLGRMTPDMGPLAICLGSHRWPEVRGTYAHSDVDRDRHTGVFTDDAAELVDRFGGRWATTTFEPGDVVVLGMYTLHGSLTNTSNRFRISCDTRYQPAAEPMDERWSGDEPTGHDVMWNPDVQLQSVQQARAGWGV